MATERFANDAASTLSADCTDAATTLSITDVTTFPTTGNFRIKIENEIILVRGVSGSDFTNCLRGQEGTTAVAHSSTDAVTLIATALSLITAGLSALTGRPFISPPPTTGWTWVNQGDATAGSTGLGYYLYVPKNAGPQLRILVRAAPATPYTATAVFRAWQPTTNYSTIGLLFRQSSDGKLHIFGRAGNANLYSTKWTDHDTFSADYANVAQCGGGSDLLTLRIADDGTNRICSVSVDGVNFSQVHSVGRTNFLTADQIGIFAHIQQNSYDIGMHLLDWSVE